MKKSLLIGIFILTPFLLVSQEQVYQTASVNDNGITYSAQALPSPHTSDALLADFTVHSRHINELLIMFAVILVLGISTFIWTSIIVNIAKKDKRFKTNKERINHIKSRKSIILGTILVLTIVGLFFFINNFDYFGFLIVLLPFFCIPIERYIQSQMKKARWMSYSCETCGTGIKHHIAEQDEEQFLDKKQLFEKSIKSIEYDIFICDHCEQKDIVTFKTYPIYEKCEECGARACVETNINNLKAATTSSSGLIEVTFTCKYCGKSHTVNKKTPMLYSISNNSFNGDEKSQTVLI